MNNLLRFKSPNLSLGLDIGGSLTKIAIASSKHHIGKLSISKNIFEELTLNDHFIYLNKQPTNNFQTQTLDLIREIKEKFKINRLFITGGGAYKYANLLTKELELQLEKIDELTALIQGSLFMNDYNSFYEFSEGKIIFHEKSDMTYPHIAVNIGSGISILTVYGEHDIKRVTGTLIGGGTLMGLSKLLIDEDNFENIMKMAEKGDNREVDLIVKDIYGGSANNIGLDENIIASSFGKINNIVFQDKKPDIKKEDIAKSILLMICYNVGQLAHLIGKFNNTNKVYIYGNFSQRFSYAIESLNYSIKFWDKDIKIRFNKYDGYLGAIGSLVEPNPTKLL